MSENSEPKIKVLIVDDEEKICRLAKINLEKRQYLVEVAYRGEEALMKIDAFEPHVVLLDIKMPGVTGDRLISMIKDMHPKVEVIMVSGNLDRVMKEDLVHYGAFDCIEKPIDFDYLNSKILEAVQRGKADAGET